MQTDLGSTALIIACQEGHTQVAALLLERGAAIDYMNKVRLLLQCSMCIITVALSDTLIGVGNRGAMPLPQPLPQTMHLTDNIAQPVHGRAHPSHFVHSDCPYSPCMQ